MYSREKKLRATFNVHEVFNLFAQTPVDLDLFLHVYWYIAEENHAVENTRFMFYAFSRVSE